jgi:GNAT superfamily N-acetyltransferase
MSNGRPSPLPLGYTMLPRGHIATLVTYLEMTHRQPSENPSPSAPPPRAPCDLRPLGTADLAAYRAIFRRVGEEWLWCSRLVMPDEQLRALIENPRIEIYVLHHERQPVGLLELDFRNESECELAFFGLVKEMIGRGVGRHLMNEAVALAWAKPIRRFFVHTCGFDHPRAVDFYRRSGFRPFALGVEVLEDPRLSGHLPRDAAPHVPLIEA